jgi:putative ABC transport system substrate-binding protein
MASYIGRRKFLATLGGAAAWPLAARAQQPASTVRRIGFLLPGGAHTTAVRGLLETFRQGLKEYGWVEGQNGGGFVESVKSEYGRDCRANERGSAIAWR